MLPDGRQSDGEELMAQKALVLYSSKTGNTEKVAIRFKETFEGKGWECDIFKVNKKTSPDLAESIDYSKYDFLCVGSYVWGSLPSNEILDVMRHNPQSVHFSTAPGARRAKGLPEEMPPDAPKSLDDAAVMMADIPRSLYEKQNHCCVIPGPRRGIAFCTYSGAHRGPKEAEPALAMLDLEMEHLQLFRCIGRFACPGKQFNFSTPEMWHGDLLHRPDERDLMKAQIWLEEKIEQPLGE
jgi:hypothetical protein